MSSIVELKKPTKPLLSNLQKTFNRLTKQIENLHNELQRRHNELDQCLLFYHQQMYPKQQAMIKEMEEFVKIIYIYYKKKLFPKKEQKLLKEMLIDHVSQYIELSNANPSEEVQAIFEELEGMSYQQATSEDLDIAKKEMQAMFEMMGISIDLSSFDPTDSFDEVKKKIIESMDEFNSNTTDIPPSPKPKSKKQLEKELKAQELERLQKKGLNDIYKQLAKVLHPDLEQDTTQKVEKEILMKKLTHAYDNKDLHSILTLELEWLNRSENQEKVHNNDQLKIYNSLLKDQVETLKYELSMVPWHPKYNHIYEYVSPDTITLQLLKKISNEIGTATKETQKLSKQLMGPEAEKHLRSLMSDYQSSFY